MTQPQLEWSAAEVHDGTLTVAVSGKPGKEWKQTFERTLAMLSTGQGWGAIKLKSGTVTVADVRDGSEDNLRFALDGAVQEANAQLAADDDEDASEHADDTADPDALSEADRRMTERFRHPS